MRSEGDDTFKTGLLKTEYKKTGGSTAEKPMAAGRGENSHLFLLASHWTVGSSEVP